MKIFLVVATLASIAYRAYGTEGIASGRPVSLHAPLPPTEVTEPGTVSQEKPSRYNRALRASSIARNAVPVPSQVLHHTDPKRQLLLRPDAFFNGGSKPYGAVRLEIREQAAPGANFSYVSGTDASALGPNVTDRFNAPVRASPFVHLDRNSSLLSAQPSGAVALVIDPSNTTAPVNGTTRGPASLQPVPTLGVTYELRLIVSDSMGVESSLSLSFEVIRDCHMEDWGNWTECTEVCGGGIQNRSREVGLPAIGSRAAQCGTTFESRSCAGDACDSGAFVSQSVTLAGLSKEQLLAPGDPSVRARLRVAQASLMPLLPGGEPYPPELVRLYSIDGVAHIDDPIDAVRREVLQYAAWLVQSAGQQAGGAGASESPDSCAGNATQCNATSTRRRLDSTDMPDTIPATAAQHAARRELALLQAVAAQGPGAAFAVSEGHHVNSEGHHVNSEGHHVNTRARSLGLAVGPGLQRLADGFAAPLSSSLGQGGALATGQQQLQYVQKSWAALVANMRMSGTGSGTNHAGEETAESASSGVMRHLRLHALRLLQAGHQQQQQQQQQQEEDMWLEPAHPGARSTPGETDGSEAPAADASAAHSARQAKNLQDPPGGSRERRGRNRGRGRGRRLQSLSSTASSSSSLSSSPSLPITLRMLLPPSLGLDEYSAARSLVGAWATPGVGLAPALRALGLVQAGATLLRLDVTSAEQRAGNRNMRPIALHGIAVVPPAAAGTSLTGEQGTLLALGGYDQDSQDVPSAVLLQTPRATAGRTSQLAQVFSQFGYPPVGGIDVSGLSVIAASARALNTTTLSFRSDGDVSATGALLPEQDGATAPRVQVDPLEAVLVTGSGGRVLFQPPAGRGSPPAAYGRLVYSLVDRLGAASEPGIVWLVPPHRRLLSSFFRDGTGGWTVSGNGQRAGADAVSHHYLRLGEGMEAYIVGQERSVSPVGEGGQDADLWYFEAPSSALEVLRALPSGMRSASASGLLARSQGLDEESSALAESEALIASGGAWRGNYGAAYGGTIRFLLHGLEGDFWSIQEGGDMAGGGGGAHSDRSPLVRLVCQSCGANRGVELGYFAGASEVQGVGEASPARFEVPLVEGVWLRRPRGQLAETRGRSAWEPVGACDLVEVLSDLSSVSILGDLLEGHEAVALDGVEVAGRGAPGGVEVVARGAPGGAGGGAAAGGGGGGGGEGGVMSEEEARRLRSIVPRRCAGSVY